MAVIGTYTPVNNWNIELVFTPDAAMDDNDKRGCFMWEFQNGTFYHALIFQAFKWEWRTEQKISPTVTIKKWIDFDLDGVADTPFGYSYYKENLVPITITCVYDQLTQKRRIYVDGYLLVTDNQNIPAINQALTLSTFGGIASDRFYGTVNSIVYTATAPSPTPLANPIPVSIKTDYNKKYIPYSQNWVPVDDILVQYQNWPDPQFDISTNCWVEAAYDIQYFAGFNGGTPVPAGVLAKMLLIQARLSSNKWRHSVRFAVLQPAWGDKSVIPNTWTTLMGFANANPLVRAILGASVAQVVVVPPGPQPDLHTIPLGTPLTAVTNIRNTFYTQIQYILSQLTRAINGCYVDDEDFSTNTNLQVWPNPAGVDMYVQFINYMFGGAPYQAATTLRGSCPPTMEFIIYDMFDLEHCVSTNQFPVVPLINVNSTVRASISAYTDRQKFWFLHQGAIRSLRFHLISKVYEIQAGKQTNQTFVQAGRTFEEDGPRPGPFLGLLKMYKICGTERFYSAYFTPSSIGIQEPKGYAWQAAAASYAEALFTKPQYRNILLFGTLLPGDVLEFPSNAASNKIFLHNTGNKLIACCARKYNGEYLIGCYYGPLNNYAGQPITKSINVTIDGINLTLTARKQGSVYHRSATGVLTWIDQWHEESHFDWWGNIVINPNNNSDMAGINDLHNGLGYIYKADLSNPTPEIVAIRENNVQGEREMRRQGMTDAPIGADSSSTGLIEINNVASVGTIASITIDGNDILNGNAYTVGSAVPATEAAGLALWINGITPAAGFRYFAYSDGAIVYLQSPINEGLTTNDLTITVVATDVSIITTTTPFYDGTSATEVYDSVTGYKYFLNADYDANGVSGGLPAPANSLTNAIDITKWMITRGNNTGMMEKDFTLASDSILSPDRGSQNMAFNVTGEGVASDTLVFIATKGFVENDLIYIKNAVAGDTITVESAPVTTSPNPYKNIYLANNTACTLSDALGVLVLQYRYDEALGGGIFVELMRAFSSTGDCEFWIGDYASAAALAAANGLIPCNSYTITNANGLEVVELRASSTSAFEMAALWVKSFVDTGQVPVAGLYPIVYDFVNDLITEIHEPGTLDVAGAFGGPYIRENLVRYFAGALATGFPFGYINVLGNTVINSGFIFVSVGYKETLAMQLNVFTNTAAIHIEGTGVTLSNSNVQGSGDIYLGQDCNFIGNNVSFGGSLSLRTGAQVSNCYFILSQAIEFIAGITVYGCEFAKMVGMVGVGSILINRSYSNKIYNYKTSTFNATINPNAAKYILMANEQICGIVNIASIAASSQIDAILTSTTPGGEYDFLYCNIIIKPDTGISVDIRDISVATAVLKNIYLGNSVGATTLTLNGTKGDWAEFAFDSDVASPFYHTWQLVNFQTYP